MIAPTTHQHVTQAVRAGQEAVSTALRTWGDTVQAVLGMPSGRADAARPDLLLDAWFDVAGKALAAQHELTKALLGVGEPAVDALTSTALRTVEGAQEYTRAATEESAWTATPANATRKGV